MRDADGTVVISRNRLGGGRNICNLGLDGKSYSRFSMSHSSCLLRKYFPIHSRWLKRYVSYPCIPVLLVLRRICEVIHTLRTSLKLSGNSPTLHRGCPKILTRSPPGRTIETSYVRAANSSVAPKPRSYTLQKHPAPVLAQMWDVLPEQIWERLLKRRRRGNAMIAGSETRF